MEESSSSPLIACCHKKPASDPHLLCRRCRPCVFYTNECDVCRTMTSEMKKDTERTWAKSDARQSQRARKTNSDGEPSTPVTRAASKVSKSTKRGKHSSVPSSPTPKPRRIDYVTTADNSALRDTTCVGSKMEVGSADNSGSRRRPAGLEKRISPAPAQLPENIFDSPVGTHRFPGFDTEFASSAIFQPPRASTHVGDTPPQVVAVSLSEPARSTDVSSLFERRPLLPTPLLPLSSSSHRFRRYYRFDVS